jgi:hypothetical protein
LFSFQEDSRCIPPVLVDSKSTFFGFVNHRDTQKKETGG